MIIVSVWQDFKRMLQQCMSYGDRGVDYWPINYLGQVAEAGGWDRVYLWLGV